MGKKIKAEMDDQKERFINGAIKNGIEKSKASYIFDQVSVFAGYGFNKSHAAAYALIAYQTAYLKAYYPEHFLTASMTLDKENTARLIGEWITNIDSNTKLLDNKDLSEDKKAEIKLQIQIDKTNLRNLKK